MGQIRKEHVVGGEREEVTGDRRQETGDSRKAAVEEEEHERM